MSAGPEKKASRLGVFRVAMLEPSDFGNDLSLTLVFNDPRNDRRYPVRFFTGMAKGDTPQDIVVKLRKMADDIEKANAEREPK